MRTPAHTRTGRTGLLTRAARGLSIRCSTRTPGAGPSMDAQRDRHAARARTGLIQPFRHEIEPLGACIQPFGLYPTRGEPPVQDVGGQR